ncbi:MAG: VOC family protein, partial [Brooklawnia sp.]
MRGCFAMHEDYRALAGRSGVTMCDMSRPIHFEIHCDDLDRAKKFYGDVF